MNWHCERCGKDGVIPPDIEYPTSFVEWAHTQTSPDCQIDPAATTLVLNQRSSLVVESGRTVSDSDSVSDVPT